LITLLRAVLSLAFQECVSLLLKQASANVTACNPPNFLSGPTRSRLSRSQKTVEVTVKRMKNAEKSGTGANNHEQDKAAHAAWQGRRAGGEGRSNRPEKERGAGLSPASRAVGATTLNPLLTWFYLLSRLPKIPVRQFL
jgi:hypothetical protein